MTLDSPPRGPLRRFLAVLAQILLIIAIWWVADLISQRWLHAVPAGIAGLAIALSLLGLGLLRREWIADGATWLLREMLLFFIPIVIAIIQYPQLLRERGLSILLVVLVSTVCVMLSTALAVDFAWRLERRWRQSRSSPGAGSAR